MRTCKRCNHGENKHNENGVCFQEVKSEEKTGLVIGCPCNEFKN